MTPMERLKMRAGRFSRLLELDAPKAILSNEVMGIFQAMILVDPNGMTELIGEHLTRTVFLRAGICPACRTEPVTGGGELCKACWRKDLKEIEQDEDDDDRFHISGPI